MQIRRSDDVTSLKARGERGNPNTVFGSRHIYCHTDAQSGQPVYVLAVFQMAWQALVPTGENTRDSQIVRFTFSLIRVLMLCKPVFIFTSSSSAILGRPHCGLSIWLSLLTLFWVYAIFIFHEKTDTTRKYSKPVILIQKWPPTVTKQRKALILRELPHLLS